MTHKDMIVVIDAKCPYITTTNKNRALHMNFFPHNVSNESVVNSTDPFLVSEGMIFTSIVLYFWSINDSRLPDFLQHLLLLLLF